MSVLMVTGIEGARNCADVVAAQLGMEVEVADGRRSALTALPRRRSSECGWPRSTAINIWKAALRAGEILAMNLNQAMR